jgi:uncharacterized cupin superfamily protein
MVAEAPLEETEAGLVPAGQGWFIMNAREARWIRRAQGGNGVPLTGWTAFEAETYFPQIGVSLGVLEPGDPSTMYHWEADQEDFLLLSGEAILIVEGEERPLRQWDFVHCPPGTRHAIVGAGNGPCIVLGIGARDHIEEPCNGGAYVVDDVARSSGACADEEVSDARLAYARFPKAEPTRYRDGWLPG